MMPILSEITQCMQKLYLMLLEIYLQIFGPFPPSSTIWINAIPQGWPQTSTYHRVPHSQ